MCKYVLLRPKLPVPTLSDSTEQSLSARASANGAATLALDSHSGCCATCQIATHPLLYMH